MREIEERLMKSIIIETEIEYSDKRTEKEIERLNKYYLGDASEDVLQTVLKEDENIHKHRKIKQELNGISDFIIEREGFSLEDEFKRTNTSIPEFISDIYGGEKEDYECYEETEE